MFNIGHILNYMNDEFDTVDEFDAVDAIDAVDEFDVLYIYDRIFIFWLDEMNETDFSTKNSK